jgi:NADH-quinone oxidoreductase subunit M
MIALLLVIIPLLGSLVTFMAKGRRSRNLALGITVIELFLAFVAYIIFRNNPDHTGLLFNQPWVNSLGINFFIQIDAMSLLLILLTSFLLPLIILSSYRTSYERPENYFGLMLLMQMALNGVFMANDGFLFYVFWELALIPIYFICLIWGGEFRGRITFKFFVYTFAGSLFMLVGLIYLYNHTNVNGMKSWAVQDIYAAGRGLSAAGQSAVFWLIFIAFAVKMPIFPFHTWQPDTYVNAPTQGTMLLSGIMLKMGTFGVLKWLLPVVPLGIAEWGKTAMILAVTGIIYASCIALVQKDFKRLIAYSSIAHVGLIAAGMFAMNQQGIQGALLQMLAHGINVVGLFCIADILFRHTGTRMLGELGGIRGMNGNFALMFLIITLGAVALPLTNGFVGEFLLLCGVYQYGSTLALFAGLTVILGAVYMLRAYQQIMLGERKGTNMAFGSLATSDKITLMVICAAIIAMGVYPGPVSDLAAEGARNIMQNMK